MLEYGNGVGQVAGRAGGGSGASMDVGAALSQFVTDSAHTISTTPPGILVLGFVVVVVGLMMLKRVF
ncbi:MAG: hypothetical protein QOE66_866 [Chloroflexota bacterium]|jgi:hypothetical protein|nr:hypothetical protein [Chloroflexota bacterium]